MQNLIRRGMREGMKRPLVRIGDATWPALAQALCVLLFFISVAAWHSHLPLNDAWHMPGRAMELVVGGEFGAATLDAKSYQHNDGFHLFPVLAEGALTKLFSGWSMLSSAMLGAFFWALAYLALNSIVGRARVSSGTRVLFAVVSGLVMLGPQSLERIGAPFSVHRTLPVFLTSLVALISIARPGGRGLALMIAQASLCAAAQLSFISGIGAWAALLAIGAWRSAAAEGGRRAQELRRLAASAGLFLLFELFYFASGIHSFDHARRIGSEAGLSFSLPSALLRGAFELLSFIFASAMDSWHAVMSPSLSAAAALAAVLAALAAILAMLPRAWGREGADAYPAVAALVGCVAFSLSLAVVAGVSRKITMPRAEPRYFCEISFLVAAMAGIASAGAEKLKESLRGFPARSLCRAALAATGAVWFAIGSAKFVGLSFSGKGEALRRADLRACIERSASVEAMMEACRVGRAHFMAAQAGPRFVPETMWRITREVIR